MFKVEALVLASEMVSPLIPSMYSILISSLVRSLTIFQKDFGSLFFSVFQLVGYFASSFVFLPYFGCVGSFCMLVHEVSRSMDFVSLAFSQGRLRFIESVVWGIHWAITDINLSFHFLHASSMSTDWDKRFLHLTEERISLAC